MKAATRVKRPKAIKAPPATSIIAAASKSSGSGSGAPGWAAGKWKSFIKPCSMKSKAAKIRRAASAFGDQADSFDMMVCSFRLPDRWPARHAGG
jgi:hypothetical protein